MAEASGGWIYTAKKDRVRDFWTSNTLKKPVFHNKVHFLPPLTIQYDTPRSATDKQWTDKFLLSNRSVDSYLAESDAFQRASFSSIIEKWKQHDKNRTDQLISSFDLRYNMKIRFRQDDKLRRSQEIKYGPIAKYYRFLGNENNPKNNRPCVRHKRHTQEYEERHLRKLLELPTTIKTRSQPYFPSKLTKHSSIDSNLDDSSITRSSESIAEQLNHTVV